jgi:DNA mismatch endonuclease (patch repair protein)
VMKPSPTKNRAPTPLNTRVSEHLKRQAVRNTGPERAAIGLLLKRGYRISTNRGDLPGKPDIIIDRHKVAIFVNGCFWHGCPLHFRCPKNNSEWWKAKIESNRRRDAIKARELRKLGYSVVTIWEHSNFDSSIRRVQRLIESHKAKK